MSAEVEASYEGWRNRLPQGAVEQFRQGLRMRLRQVERGEDGLIERAVALLSISLVEHADRVGFVVVPDAQWTALHEKMFDYGRQLGLAGQVEAAFVASERQFIHFLTYELERERARCQALESWWVYRLRQRLARLARQVAGWCVPWRRKEGDD